MTSIPGTPIRRIRVSQTLIHTKNISPKHTLVFTGGNTSGSGI